ncbi:MAG: hypothetical protein ABSB74_15010 [Tepidisphaeraceae bacterium]
MYEFRWNVPNVDHIDKHGIKWTEAEFVVNHPARGFPRREAGQKFRVWGRTLDGRYLQVVYIFDPPGVIYVIHARPLTESEKRRLRQRNN